MKRTLLLATLALAASIGSQVANAAASPSFKVGNLTFALTDTYQYRVFQGKNPMILATNTVPLLENCLGDITYKNQVQVINNKRIIAAIGAALGVTFTGKANLAIVNYDNFLPAPPYPPYLIDPAPNTFNGPRDTSDGSLIVAMETWPNEVQIDWVEYDKVNGPNDSVPSDLWPKALVYVSDPSNGSVLLQCVEVTEFWSFEEAYCYFCWDTIDRVTQGTFSTGTTSTGDICIGQRTQCGTKGNGTTRFYLTIKFNNDDNSNIWLDPAFETIRTVSANDRLIFTVGGVIIYNWKISPLNSLATAMGTMAMSQATGYGQNPWCGVLVGSVKNVETTDVKVPVCWTGPTN